MSETSKPTSVPLFEMRERKPAFGDACNGCGLCCTVKPCALSVEYLGSEIGPCAALEWEDGRAWCGLIRNASRYIGTPAFGDRYVGALVGEALGVGKGCDAS